MSFNSWDFAIFFPAAVILYFVLPARIRTVWLLIASYYFYMSWNAGYAVLIAASTLITWVCALPSGAAAKKIALAAALVSNLSILAVFKYADFFLGSLEDALAAFGFTVHTGRLDLLLPVGISFYTFQALSYTIDVYRGDTKPEKNLIKYALFVSFFPQLVAGPIERSGRLMKQIEEVPLKTRKELLDPDRICSGLLLMLWGLFMKLCIADRISPFVKNVYSGYSEMGFIEIAVAAVLFSLQIYCDFGGYTSIARGAARVMGFELMQNFRQPYFAQSIRDFWRRWHISLTTWFTDYVYIPLGGNRKGKGVRARNILIVFLLSGLWHGASWNYVVWGLIHGVLQIAETLFARPAADGQKRSAAGRVIRIILTFAVTAFAWIFFAADSCAHAAGIVGRCFAAVRTKPLDSLGLSIEAWIALGICVLILAAVDIAREKGRDIMAFYRSLAAPLQAVAVVFLLTVVVMLGAYGGTHDTSFIYFRF